MLYSFKENEQVKTYRQAIEVGEKFIEETQKLLLRTNQVQANKVLVPYQTGY